MSNDNTFPHDAATEALGKLYDQYSKIEDEREQRELEEVMKLAESGELPEISSETEAALLAEIEADLDEHYGPKKA